MNALQNHLFNQLPDAVMPTIGKLMFSGRTDDLPQVVKKLPSGRVIGKYTNSLTRAIKVLYGTNGPNGIGFCIATEYGSPCPNEAGPDIWMMPGDSIFVIQGATRWVAVNPADNNLIFSPSSNFANINPLATAAAAGLEEDQSFLETLRNASPLMKVAAVVAVAAFGWYLLK